jgi:hypothetical protein
VKHKNKVDKDKKAADQIAEIMYAALMNLPEAEREPAIKDIQAIKFVQRKSSKRAAKPRSLRGPSTGAVRTRKRARRDS